MDPHDPASKAVMPTTPSCSGVPWHATGDAEIKLLTNDSVLPNYSDVEIVAKRATGSRIVGNQGETRKVRVFKFS